MKSLFIGRWQPFHEGHKALIEVALKEGKNVLIAIRDTPIHEKNPYTLMERKKMIEDGLSEWGDRVEIIAIPDIAEVCYGRDVGYAIRKIDLTPDLEEISGTKIRDDLVNRQ